MKKILIAVTLCSMLILNACSPKEQSKKEETIKSTSVTKKKADVSARKNLSIGETYKFSEADLEKSGYDSVGLEITVDKVSVDKNLQLNTEYSSEDYTGLTPIIVDATFKNTTNKPIDLTNFDLIDGNGKKGKWAYISGVSTDSTDILNAGQMVKVKDVFGVSSDKKIFVNYETAAWQVKE